MVGHYALKCLLFGKMFELKLLNFIMKRSIIIAAIVFATVSCNDNKNSGTPNADSTTVNGDSATMGTGNTPGSGGSANSSGATGTTGTGTASDSGNAAHRGSDTTMHQ